MSRLTCFGWVLGMAIGVKSAFWANGAVAQITPDGTLGAESSVVTPNVDINGINSARIDGGAIRGSNQFHSFEQFNIDEGRGAYFSNPNGIENIISRVTGGNASNINGTLGVLGSANLFFINPNGMIFGQNARLDVGGSFVASTASAIQFGEQGFFSATNPASNAPLLTINPTALLFNQIAAPIQNSSTARLRGLPLLDGTSSIGVVIPATGLGVRDGKSLLLVGGNIDINGGALNAFGGRVELGGLAQPGTVGLNVTNNNLSLSFPENLALASVSLTNGAEVNVAAGGGGSIAINAGDINVLQRSSLRAGINRLVGSDDAQAGDITLNANMTLRVEDSFVYNAVFGSGNGGSVRVDTGKLIVRDGVIATATYSGGGAGDLIVKAKDSVELTGSPSSNGYVSTNIPLVISDTFAVNIPRIPTPLGLFSFSGSIDIPDEIPSFFSAILPRGSGTAGDLTLETGQLLVSNGAVVAAGTATTGRGGNLTIRAKDFIELAGTSPNEAPPGYFTIAGRVSSGFRNGTDGLGAAGDITIETGRLIVRDGAWVTTGTLGEMPAGKLIINASESVELNGSVLANGLPSALGSGTQGAGNGNSLTINTRRLRVSDGGIISAGTAKSGQGAELTINSLESVELTGVSRQGVFLDAAQELIGIPGGILVSNIAQGGSYPSGVISGTAGTGNAGDLTINTGQLLISGGAQASVSTLGAGDAGSLSVYASSIKLSGTSAQIRNNNDIAGSSLLSTAVNETSTGNGGNITLQTNSLTITDGAALTASTNGQGNAGNIIVRANTLEVTDGGRLSTSTTSSKNAGNITLEVSDRTTLTGLGSQLLAQTTESSTGDAGNLRINTPELLVQDGAAIAVNSLGTGTAGNLAVDAASIRLDNKATLSADTRSNSTNSNQEQATINLRATDLVLLRRNSNITTNATGVNVNGGNINIDTNFLIALENSDISADSKNSRGGNVRINALGVFGTQTRNVPSDQTSDITATGSNLDLSGSIELNVLDIDPTQEQVLLQDVPVDVNNLIANSCIARSNRSSVGTFFITGSGGLPSRPGYPSISHYTTGSPRSASNALPKPNSTGRPWRKGDPIVEPSGVYRLPSGHLVLSRECSKS